MALFRGLLYAVGMLKHRYERTDLFALVPQLGLRFEPQLEQLDRLLDDDAIVEAIRSGMAPRLTPIAIPRTTLHPGAGRPSHARGHAALLLELRAGRVLRQRQPGPAPVPPGLP